MPTYDYYIDNAYFITSRAWWDTSVNVWDLIVSVRGLQPGWGDYGYFQATFDAGYSISSIFLYEDSPSSTATKSYYEDKGYGLTEGDTYTIYVRFRAYNGDNVVIPLDSTTSGQFEKVIEVGGGGGGTDPYFTATGSNTNSTITITVSDLQDTDYDYLYFWVSSSIDSPYTNINPYTFYSVPDGTYNVRAYYVKDNIEYTIYDAYGNSSIAITIDSGGGPTPSGDWDYGSPIYLNNLSSNYTSSSSINFMYDNGAYFEITFANSGYARFYSSNQHGDMVAYVSDVNTGFDDTNGVPYNYDRYSRLQNGFNIDFYSVTAGTTYYLWVTAANGDKTNWGSFYLNIVVPTAPVVYPTFTASVINNNQISFTVSNKGNYYLRYKVRLTSDPNDDTYDTWDKYHYLVTDTILTVPNLQYNTWYRVNVGYSLSNSSGEVTWIRSTQDPLDLQTGSEPVGNSYVYIYNGSNWQKAVPYIFNGSSWQQAQAYIFNGSQWKKCG